MTNLEPEILNKMTSQERKKQKCSICNGTGEEPVYTFADHLGVIAVICLAAGIMIFFDWLIKYFTCGGGK